MRRELARHNLQHSALDLNETAYLLGYEDSTTGRAARPANGARVTPGRCMR